MNHGELTNDPQQRLVEVLLEQEFAATRAVAPRADWWPSANAWDCPKAA